MQKHLQTVRVYLRSFRYLFIFTFTSTGKVTFRWKSWATIYAVFFYIAMTVVVYYVGRERIRILGETKKFDEKIYAYIFVIFLVPHFWIPFVGWGKTFLRFYSIQRSDWQRNVHNNKSTHDLNSISYGIFTFHVNFMEIEYHHVTAIHLSHFLYLYLTLLLLFITCHFVWFFLFSLSLSLYDVQFFSYFYCHFIRTIYTQTL